MPGAKSKRKKIIAKTKQFFLKLPWETVGDVARTTATVARDSTNAVPIAASACGGVASVLDHGKRVKDIKKNAKSLLERAAELAAAVDTGKSTSDVSTSRAQAVKSLCNEVQLCVTPLRRASKKSRLLHLHEYEDLINKYHARLDKALQSFVVATTTKTERDTSKIQGTLVQTQYQISKIQHSLIASTSQTDHDINEIKKSLIASTSQTDHNITEIKKSLIASTSQTDHNITEIKKSLIASTSQIDHSISEIKKTLYILSISTVSTVLF